MANNLNYVEALQKHLERETKKAEALEKELELQKELNSIALSFINDKGLANEFIEYIPTQTK